MVPKSNTRLRSNRMKNREACVIIDNERFIQATEQAKSYCAKGIGTLAERTLHKALKLYIEPNTEMHEKEYLGMVVDILNERGITEVQTRSFEKLNPKLSRFFSDSQIKSNGKETEKNGEAVRKKRRTEPVNIVYPIAVKRYISRIDDESGEISKPRKAPRTGRAADALLELYRIEDHLKRDDLKVTLFLVNTIEYKAKNGKGKDKKKWAPRLERIPTELVDIITLNSPEDYAKLIPTNLAEHFTAAEFNRAASFRTRRAYYALKLLCTLGVLERRKVGRSFVYTRIIGNDQA